MSVKIRLMTCGWLEADLAMIMEGGEGRVQLPIPSVLIEHRQGLALFDTGLHETLHRDTARLRSNAKLFKVEMRADDHVGARLAAMGIDPADIRYVVNSHLHFDHCGGNAQAPNATLVIQKPEWRAGRLEKLHELDVYNPDDYALGQPVMEIEGEHDLFGDGSVLCVPTYGHTSGHQSLVVRSEHGEFVFAADTCYMRETLEQGRLPTFGYNLDWQRKSLDWLREKRRAGAALVYGHDARQWPALAMGPAELTEVRDEW